MFGAGYIDGRPDPGTRIDPNNPPVSSGSQINPALAVNHIHVIKDTHGKTSHLSADDIDALIAYLKSLERVSNP